MGRVARNDSVASIVPPEQARPRFFVALRFAFGCVRDEDDLAQVCVDSWRMNIF